MKTVMIKYNHYFKLTLRVCNPICTSHKPNLASSSCNASLAMTRPMGMMANRKAEYVNDSRLKNSELLSSSLCARTNNDFSRPLSNVSIAPSSYLEASNEESFRSLADNAIILPDFISPQEEEVLFEELEPVLKRLRYESNHWDDAIHGFRETERKQWTEKSQTVIDRIKNVAFAPEASKLAYTHVLDLQESGYIKPHIDSVRYCGTTIAGLSLLSSSVMKFVHEKDENKWGNVLLERRSLYIIKGVARYDYTHELLKGDLSEFKGLPVARGRRISIICRDEPKEVT